MQHGAENELRPKQVQLKAKGKGELVVLQPWESEERMGKWKQTKKMY